jgi:hypothetical protein
MRMQEERLLHDTGRVPPVLLLVISPFGLMAIYGAILLGRPSPFAAALCGAFGLVMLSAWFWRNRFYYDATRHEIVVRSLVWFPRHLPLARAVSLYLHDVRVMTSAVSGTDICIRYADGREKWLTRVEPGDPGHFATIVSEAASLPILPESRGSSVLSALVWGTVVASLVGGLSFLSHQPKWFLWPFRLFCVIALVGWWYEALQNLRTRRRTAKPQSSSDRLAERLPNRGPATPVDNSSTGEGPPSVS